MNGMRSDQHQCAATNCTRQIPVDQLMCYDHWSHVPTEIRRRIWRNYRRGERMKGSPSPAYLSAVNDAIAAVEADERLTE